MNESANASQRKEPQAPTDPRVGLNPTGRPRRSSASSRRKHARRAAARES